MKPARTDRPLHYPERWTDIPHGEWLAAEIQERLNAWCPLLFGYHLLKVGALSGQLSCDCSAIRHQCAIGSQGQGLDLLGLEDELPLQTGSVDACLLAHTLDYSPDPHQVLREVERVLTDDGWVIISGFNPHGLVGLGRLWPPARRVQPWCARMFSPERVEDWLHLLGFEVIRQERFGFSALSRRSRIQWWKENLGRDYAGYLASVYVLAARKRRLPMTPITRFTRLRKPVAIPGMARI